jgi:predicted nucleotidyltransferase
MESIFNKFIELMASFDKNEVEYVVIGGIAINLHGFSRNTEDIDLFVNPNEDNIKKLQFSLFEIFKDKDIYEITLEELKKYQVIRYISEESTTIDVIAKLGDRFDFSDIEYDIKIIDGIKIKFANLKTLYLLKEKTYREIDQLDLKFIKAKQNSNAN